MFDPSIKNPSILIERIIALNEARGADAAWDIMESIRSDLGLDYIAFGPLISQNGANSVAIDFASDSVRPAIQAYIDADMARNDPNVRALANGASYVIPGQNLTSKTAAEEQGLIAVLDHFKEFGIREHIALHAGLAGFRETMYLGAGYYASSNIADCRTHALSVRPVLSLLARVFVAKATKPRESTISAILTAAEADVLRGLARGLSHEDIADQRRKSLSTVRHQIYSAQRRLGARSVIEAVLIAERLGLLNGD